MGIYFLTSLKILSELALLHSVNKHLLLGGEATVSLSVVTV